METVGVLIRREGGKKARGYEAGLWNVRAMGKGERGGILLLQNYGTSEKPYSERVAAPAEWTLLNTTCLASTWKKETHTEGNCCHGVRRLVVISLQHHTNRNIRVLLLTSNNDGDYWAYVRVQGMASY